MIKRVEGTIEPMKPEYKKLLKDVQAHIVDENDDTVDEGKRAISDAAQAFSDAIEKAQASQSSEAPGTKPKTTRK